MRAESTQVPSERVALFPLNVVLFPGGLLPLRIFEPRYQRMVSECLRGELPFAVASIVEGPEAGGVAATATTGTLARIIDWEQLEDGLLGLLCEGEATVAIGETAIEADQLLRADVIRQPGSAPQPIPDDLFWLESLLIELLQRLGSPYDRLAIAEPSADHVANRLIELLPLPLPEKQALFDTRDGMQRLRRLAALIDTAEGDDA